MTADPATCSFQGSPIAREIDFRTSCDIAKRTMAQSFVPYVNANAAAGAPAVIKIGDKEITAPTIGKLNDKAMVSTRIALPRSRRSRRMCGRCCCCWFEHQGRRQGHEYADGTGDPCTSSSSSPWFMVPIAAMLVELFPTRIRYVDELAVPHW